MAVHFGSAIAGVTGSMVTESTFPTPVVIWLDICYLFSQLETLLHLCNPCYCDFLIGVLKCDPHEAILEYYLEALSPAHLFGTVCYLAYYYTSSATIALTLFVLFWCNASH